MRPRVYLETSVISYLTARPARDVVALAHQTLTRAWWENRRQEYELYTSKFVIEEISRGDADAARARLETLAQTQLLSTTAAGESLAPMLLRNTRLPVKAFTDMSHVATAAVHGMNYLLTWNCRHLANAVIFKIVEETCREQGYEPPVI